MNTSQTDIRELGEQADLPPSTAGGGEGVAVRGTVSRRGPGGRLRASLSPVPTTTVTHRGETREHQGTTTFQSQSPTLCQTRPRWHLTVHSLTSHLGLASPQGGVSHRKLPTPLFLSPGSPPAGTCKGPHLCCHVSHYSPRLGSPTPTSP